MRHIYLIIAFFLIAPSFFAQQEIGKIFSPEEATKLFGEVILEKEIPISVVINATTSSRELVLFNIVKKELFVSNDNKELIFSSASVNSTNIPNVNYTFSKHIVVKFLDTNPKAKIIKVQMRGSVLTLFNGNSVLEMAIQCPPYCWDN